MLDEEAKKLLDAAETATSSGAPEVQLTLTVQEARAIADALTHAEADADALGKHEYRRGYRAGVSAMLDICSELLDTTGDEQTGLAVLAELHSRIVAELTKVAR